MKTRRILSTILALTMLLTLFSGEFASAAGMKIVTAGEELAYDPLAETASVAYEQHDAGYAVSLDRAADSVTMHVTAVPGSRGADKARLYVRTGVALKAGVAYRVSFALSSEQKLADYTVNFDGDTAAAYGKLDKRSIDAGGTDRVEYTVTPKAASGELVLRLLLGKTEVNTLRFSDLAVEEAPAEQSGANKMLVDKLNYAAPGAIRCAAEAGYSAEMSSTDTSATMTVTNVPKSGAEVWKLKLMVSTGLKPEPGKTYRFRATLNASNSGSYEACYNEGEVEKGYDVLYNQSLRSGNQTVERMIYVPTDKENPGELIVQFSLGKLSKGTKVTISKVTVEEASPAYTSALAKDFALDKTENFERKFYENKPVSYTNVTPAAFNWSSAATVTMEKGVALYNYSDKAKIVVKGINVWDGLLTVHTGTELDNNTIYRVSLNVKANANYDNYEILYGNGYDPNNDNNHKYGALKKRALRGGADYDTVEYLFNTGSDGGVLQITLQVGATGNVAKTVTVSGLKIERMDKTGYTAKVLSTLNFDTAVIDRNELTGEDDVLRYASEFEKSADGGYASFKIRKKDNTSADWKAEFRITACPLTAGSCYRVKLDVWADRNVAAGDTNKLNILLGTNNDGNANNHNAGLFGQPLTAYKSKTMETTFVAVSGKTNLCITVQCGLLDEGTTITIGNLRVEELNSMELGGDVANVTYPSGNTAFAANEKKTVGSFYIENYDNLSCVLSGNGTSSATVTCTGKHDYWSRKMTVSNICNGALNQNQTYLLNCSVVVDGATMAAGENSDNYNVMFGTDPDGNRDKFMGLFHTTDISIPVARYIRPDSADQTLNFYFEIGRLTPDNSKIIISDISVKPVLVPDETAWNGTDVTPSFRFEALAVYNGPRDPDHS